MTRVLVVDDHPVVLAGLTAMIDANDDLEVVGSATTVAGALALPVDLGPDLCVLDLQLPDGDGISLGIAAKQRWPGTRVLVLTMSAEPAAVMRSLSADLDGYVMKDADPGELLAAIRSAAAGAVVLGRGASRTIIAAAVALPAIEPLAALDARDREILDLLVRGKHTNEIARELFLAPKTIRNRISDILGKLGVPDRDEAIAMGRAGGLGH